MSHSTSKNFTWTELVFVLCCFIKNEQLRDILQASPPILVFFTVKPGNLPQLCNTYILNFGLGKRWGSILE